MRGVGVNVQQKFELAGQGTTIPNDNIGRLSYYLNCIDACIPGVIDDEYINYKQCAYFSTDIRRGVILLATILKPSILEDRVIYRTSAYEMEALSPGYNNTFLKLTERTNITFLDIDDDGAVGLNVRGTEVTQRMLYTETWLNNHYYLPLQRIEQELTRALQQQEQQRQLRYQEQQQQKQQVNYVVVVQNPNTNVNNNNYVSYRDRDNEEFPLKKFFFAFLMVAFIPVIGMCFACAYLSKEMKTHGRAFCFCVLIPGLVVYSIIYSNGMVLLNNGGRNNSGGGTNTNGGGNNSSPYYRY